MTGVAVRKLSVSMPESVVERALRSASAQELSLSTWLAEAARERLDREVQVDMGYQAARELVMEYEAEHGPIPQETWDWAEHLVSEAVHGPQG